MSSPCSFVSTSSSSSWSSPTSSSSSMYCSSWPSSSSTSSDSSTISTSSSSSSSTTSPSSDSSKFSSVSTSSARMSSFSSWTTVLATTRSWKFASREFWCAAPSSKLLDRTGGLVASAKATSAKARARTSKSRTWDLFPPNISVGPKQKSAQRHLDSRVQRGRDTDERARSKARAFLRFLRREAAVLTAGPPRSNLFLERAYRIRQLLARRNAFEREPLASALVRSPEDIVK